MTKKSDIRKAVFSLAFGGAKFSEIAKVLGKTRNAVQKIAAAHGFPRVTRRNARRLWVWISDDDAAALSLLSWDNGGASFDETLEDLVHFALEDGAVIGRRMLRVRGE